MPSNCHHIIRIIWKSSNDNLNTTHYMYCQKEDNVFHRLADLSIILRYCFNFHLIQILIIFMLFLPFSPSTFISFSLVVNNVKLLEMANLYWVFVKTWEKFWNSAELRQRGENCFINFAIMSQSQGWNFLRLFFLFIKINLQTLWNKDVCSHDTIWHRGYFHL